MQKYEVKYQEGDRDFMSRLMLFLDRIGGTLNSFEFKASTQIKNTGGKVQQSRQEEAKTVIRVPAQQVQALDELRKMKGVISVEPC